MNGLEERAVQCPCCGETISLLIDCSLAQQSYVEDCQVCCQPMVVAIAIEDDEIAVSVAPENG